nr:RidA family protein [Sphingomonas sp. Y57]
MRPSLIAALSGVLAAAAAQAQPISTADAPRAIGPYVQAVAAGDTLYLSGQLPLDPVTGNLVEGDIGKQTERVLLNLKAVLAARGMTLDDAVMAHVFLTDLTEFQAMNAVYGRYFKSPPARATVEVKGLAKGARIEISLIAVRRH